jgi:uncharacterized protein YjbI with pentapeptide repeats
LFADFRWSDIRDTFMKLDSQEEVVTLSDNNTKAIALHDENLKVLNVQNSKLSYLEISGNGKFVLNIISSDIKILKLIGTEVEINLKSSSLQVIRDSGGLIKSLTMDSLSRYKLQALEISSDEGYYTPVAGFYIFKREVNRCLDANGEEGFNDRGRECTSFQQEMHEADFKIFLMNAFSFEHMSLTNPSGEGYKFVAGDLYAPRFINNTYNSVKFIKTTINRSLRRNVVFQNSEISGSDFINGESEDEISSRSIYQNVQYKNETFNSAIYTGLIIDDLTYENCTFKNSYFHAKSVSNLVFKNVVFDSSALDFETIEGPVTFINPTFINMDVSGLTQNPFIKIIKTE